MSFWDFLKSVLPEKLVNIKIDNRKIEITNSSILIGNQQINDTKVIHEIIRKIETYKDKENLPFHLLHKDLENSFIEYENLSIENQESIRQLKTVLPQEDIECILMARRVKLIYDKGEHELGKKLHRNLEKNFPQKGSKVFNLIGGGYFDELIIPFIEVYKMEYDEKYIEKFREFYFEILKFFPLAYFIGNNTSEMDLKNELVKRLNFKGIPFIRLHAIGQNNMDKIEKIVKELKINDTFSISDKKYTTSSGLKAQIFEIAIKK